MTNLPCPNPACTHQFSASELKGATALKCPRCGTVFQFRQAAPPPAKPAAPVAKPAPAVTGKPVPLARPVALPVAAPAARPVAVAAPVARPAPTPTSAGPPSAPVARSPAHERPPVPDEKLVSPMVRARLRGRGTSTVKRLIGVVVFLIVAGGAVLAFVAYRNRLQKEQDAVKGNVAKSGEDSKFTGRMLNVNNSDEKAFQIVASAKTWRQDEGLKRGLKAILALKRSEGDDGEQSRAAWIAAAAKDFGLRKPRDAELVKEGLERLENLFGETLELKEKPESKELAGRRAQAIEFKGTLKQVVWRGECYMLTRHGIGYWFYIAAPTLPEAREELEELQKDKRGFALADERDGWSEQPPKSETFRSDKLPLSLTAQEAVWQKQDVNEVDEHGVLLLYGRYLQEKDNRKNARVLVVALEKQATPLKAARSYFEEERKKENKDYQFEPSGEGVIGERKIAYVEVKVQLGPQPTRYFLIAAIQGQANTIGILCDSTWESRQIWRQDFLDLLKTFRLKQ
jgi:hypothetical protein